MLVRHSTEEWNQYLLSIGADGENQNFKHALPSSFSLIG